MYHKLNLSLVAFMTLPINLRNHLNAGFDMSFKRGLNVLLKCRWISCHLIKNFELYQLKAPFIITLQYSYLTAFIPFTPRPHFKMSYRKFLTRNESTPDSDIEEITRIDGYPGKLQEIRYDRYNTTSREPTFTTTSDVVITHSRDGTTTYTNTITITTTTRYEIIL